MVTFPWHGILIGQSYPNTKIIKENCGDITGQNPVAHFCVISAVFNSFTSAIILRTNYKLLFYHRYLKLICQNNGGN